MTPLARFRAGQASVPPAPVVDLDEAIYSHLVHALARNEVRAVWTPYETNLLGHPHCASLAGLEPSFEFRFQGDLQSDAFEVATRNALLGSGVDRNKAAEAVAAETAELARLFVGLSTDPRPSVRLATTAPSAPSASTDPSRLALVHAFRRPDEPPFELPLAACLGRLAEADAKSAAWHHRPLRSGELAIMKLSGGRPELDGPRRGVKSRQPRLVLTITSESATQRRPEAVTSSPRARRDADVVLISMPFGPLAQASLGLSLLKASIPERSCDVLYFSLPYAETIGSGLYTWISEFQPFHHAMLGEWIFRPALFRTADEDIRRYVDRVLLRRTRAWGADTRDQRSFDTLVPDALVDQILQLRHGLDSFLEQCVEQVLARRPRVVGFTSCFQQQVASLALARRLKERDPTLAILFGGPNCEGVMGLEAVRQFTFVDAVVSGEGDQVFPELIERALAGRSFLGLEGVYCAASPEVAGRHASPAQAPSPPTMDTLPEADFGDFFRQWEASPFSKRQATRLLFETSRGCWWGSKKHCTFCGLNGAGMAYRSKTGEHALAQLEALVRRYPGLDVCMVDNILDMRYFETFLPQLADKGLGLDVFYEVKSNLGRAHLERLADAGVRKVQPGIESLDDTVLHIMGKGVRGLQNIRLLKLCKEYGVFPAYNLIWGFPGEPPEAYARMCASMPLLAHLDPPSGMSKILLERFSPNFDRSEELGFADVVPAEAYEYIYPFSTAAIERLAYNFSYRYREPRDVESYAAPFREAIADWRRAHPVSQLIQIDRGDHLLVLDSRPVAARPLTIVDGPRCELLRACEAPQTFAGMRSVLGGASELEEALEPLLADGLVLCDGERLLALPIPGSLAQPSD